MSEIEVGSIKLRRRGMELVVYECTSIKPVSGRDMVTWTEVGYIEFDPYNPDPHKDKTKK